MNILTRHLPGIFCCLLTLAGSAQQPELMMPDGHSEMVSSAIFSHDGKYVVTSSWDQKVIVWELQSGKPVKSIHLSLPVGDLPHQSWMSEDNQWVFIDVYRGLGHSSLLSWNLQTGALFEENDASYNPRQKWLIPARENSKGRFKNQQPAIIDIENGKLVKALTTADEAQYILIGEGGNYYARYRESHRTTGQVADSAFFDVFNFHNPKMIRRIVRTDTTGNIPDMSSHIYGQYLVTIETNGRIGVSDLVTGFTNYMLSRPEQIVRIIAYSALTNQLLLESYPRKRSNTNPADSKPGEPVKGFQTVIVNLTNSTISASFKKQDIFAASFSPDGKYLVAQDYHGDIAVYNVKTGNQISALTRADARVEQFAYSDDGKFVAIAFIGRKNTAIWDVSAHTHFMELSGFANPILEAGFDHKETSIITHDSACIKIWDAQEGKIVTVLDSSRYCRGPSISVDDRKLLALADQNTTLRIWDVATGKIIANWRDSLQITQAAFSPDGKYIYIEKETGIQIRSVPSGNPIADYRYGFNELLLEFSGFSRDFNYFILPTDDSGIALYKNPVARLIKKITRPGGIKGVVYSGASDYFITTSVEKDSAIHLWNISDGQLLKSIPTGAAVDRVIISSDGKYIFSQSISEQYALWEAATGKLIVRIASPVKPKYEFISCIPYFSPDGSELVTNWPDAGQRIYESASGKLLLDLPDDQGETDIRYSRDSKFLLLKKLHQNGMTVYDSHTMNSIRYIPLPNGDNGFTMTKTGDRYLTFRNSEMTIGYFGDSSRSITLTSVSPRDYLVTDKEGRFDGTEAARNTVYYSCGLKTVDIEQVKNLGREPGLASKVMGNNTEPITALPVSQIPICTIIPDVERLAASKGIDNFRITPDKAGLGEVLVFVNDKQVKSIPPATLSRQGPSYLLRIVENEFTPWFTAGTENTITVKATSAMGGVSSRGFGIQVKPSGRPKAIPDLYILTIGVNKYGNEALRLNYAAQDALHFEASIVPAARKLLNGDNREHVHAYNLTSDSSLHTSFNKGNVRAVFDTIAQRANPGDILFVFFAGHGAVIVGKKDYYLLTPEAASLQQLETVPANVSISTQELRKWMAAIKSGKQVLVVDACSSGKIIDELKAKVAGRAMSTEQQWALDNLRDRTGTVILAASASDQVAFETSFYSEGLLTYSLLSSIKLGTGLKNYQFIDVNKWFYDAQDQVQRMAREINGRQDPQILGTGSFDIGLADDSVRRNILLSNRKKIFTGTKLHSAINTDADPLYLSRKMDGYLRQLSAQPGASALFIPENTMDESYSVRGSYRVTGDSMIVNAFVYKGETEKVFVIDRQRSREQGDALLKEIADAAYAYFASPAETKK